MLQQFLKIYSIITAQYIWTHSIQNAVRFIKRKRVPLTYLLSFRTLASSVKWRTRVFFCPIFLTSRRAASTVSKAVFDSGNTHAVTHVRRHMVRDDSRKGYRPHRGSLRMMQYLSYWLHTFCQRIQNNWMMQQSRLLNLRAQVDWSQFVNVIDFAKLFFSQIVEQTITLLLQAEFWFWNGAFGYQRMTKFPELLPHGLLGMTQCLFCW